MEYPIIPPKILNALLTFNVEREKKLSSGETVRSVMTEKKKTFNLDNVFGTGERRDIRGTFAIFIDFSCILIIDEIQKRYWITGNIHDDVNRNILSLLEKDSFTPAKIRVKSK